MERGRIIRRLRGRPRHPSSIAIVSLNINTHDSRPVPRLSALDSVNRGRSLVSAFLLVELYFSPFLFACAVDALSFYLAVCLQLGGVFTLGKLFFLSVMS